MRSGVGSGSNKNVLGLDVTMIDALGMAGPNAFRDLQPGETNFIVLSHELLSIDDGLEQVSTGAVLHDDEHKVDVFRDPK